MLEKVNLYTKQLVQRVAEHIQDVKQPFIFIVCLWCSHAFWLCLSSFLFEFKEKPTIALQIQYAVCDIITINHSF